MAGRIYYIAATEGEVPRVKIGFTSGSPYARLRTLQTGSPCPLVLVAVHDGTLEDEKRLHAEFSESRVHGEWFDMTEELFKRLCMIVWLQAKQSMILGEPIERWVRSGLRSMHEDKPLPEELAALI